MNDSGKILVPMVHSGACVYRGVKPRYINVQKAYRMVNEWIEAVVKPLLGHWRQMRPTWCIKMAPGLLYNEGCYGVTEMTQSTIEISLDTRAHTGYSELLAYCAQLEKQANLDRQNQQFVTTGSTKWPSPQAAMTVQ